MKRLTALCIATVLLVGGMKLYEARQPAAVVQACTYSLEHTNTATKSFYSPYFQADDVLHAEVTTYAGNTGSGYQCGQYKQYESLQWTTLGTPGSYFSEVRAWTCGGYDGAWTASAAHVWSAELYYPIYCGRQADNNGSYFHIAANGVNVSVYVNQG
jgi:hypothetical protein